MSIAAAPRRSIIPWLFPLGLVLVVAVNMVLLFFALRSAPGLVVTNAYERGRGYGTQIERMEAQDALGWGFDMRHDVGAERIVVSLADANGREIPGLVVSAVADRPMGRAPAIDVALSPAGSAHYAGRFSPPARGAWDITVIARDGAGHDFRVTRRVVVR